MAGELLLPRRKSFYSPRLADYLRYPPIRVMTPTTLKMIEIIPYGTERMPWSVEYM
jgi:hypothetical protein